MLPSGNKSKKAGKCPGNEELSSVVNDREQGTEVR